MSNAFATIDHHTLLSLAHAGAVQGAQIVGSDAGWRVLLSCGPTVRALAAKRGAARTFRRFETLVAYLKGLGISQYQVDAAGYDPVAAKVVRPDAAARMRQAFEAKAYDDWVRERIAKSLADPSPRIPHAQVMAEARTLIDIARKRRSDEKAKA